MSKAHQIKKSAIRFFQSAPYSVKVIFASLQGFWLNYWRKQNREKYLQEVAQKDQWSRQQIDDWQQDALRKMLDHAVKTVPYYQNLWTEIWRNDPELSHLNLNNWPILEKSVVKANPESFLSEKYQGQKLYSISTSGTSGTPMNFVFDREALSYWYAMYEHRIKRWNGVSDADNWANIGGQLICDIQQKKPPFWVWNFPMKQLYLSSYHISPENIEHYLKAIIKYRVQYLLGYVSSIYNLAREGLEQGLEFPVLKLVITNAEPLFEHQRVIIAKAFSCKVIQTYSGCEYAFGGNEDLSGAMYLWPEAGILEVVDRNDQILPAGKNGNFVITGLINKAMPLIRYRVGDSGVIAPYRASQTRNYATLEEITGRNDDLIYTIDGKLVGRLDPVFKGDFNIKAAQIIQERLDFIRILIVPFPAYDNQEGEEIVQRLRERIGSQSQISLELVDSIPTGANGKFKAVISHVKQTKHP